VVLKWKVMACKNLQEFSLRSGADVMLQSLAAEVGKAEW
jgi:hypothetical protein